MFSRFSGVTHEEYAQRLKADPSRTSLAGRSTAAPVPRVLPGTLRAPRLGQPPTPAGFTRATSL